MVLLLSTNGHDPDLASRTGGGDDPGGGPRRDSAKTSAAELESVQRVFSGGQSRAPAPPARRTTLNCRNRAEHLRERGKEPVRRQSARESAERAERANPSERDGNHHFQINDEQPGGITINSEEPREPRQAAEENRVVRRASKTHLSKSQISAHRPPSPATTLVFEDASK